MARFTRASVAHALVATWTRTGTSTTSQFLTYVEEARVEMFQAVPAVGAEHASTRSRAGILVKSSDITYLRPLFHRPAPVPIDVWVTKIGAAHFCLGYEVHDDDGTIYARASSVMVPYDFGAERPRRLTPHEREWLADVPRAGRHVSDRSTSPTRTRRPRRSRTWAGWWAWTTAARYGCRAPGRSSACGAVRRWTC